jgi:hypothetical protein
MVACRETGTPFSLNVALRRAPGRGLSAPAPESIFEQKQGF